MRPSINMLQLVEAS